MRSKAAFAIILTCMIVGVAAGSYMQATAGTPPPSFTMTLTGKGYDKARHQYDAVSITLHGTRDGKLTMTVSLWMNSGNVNVQNYGTFAVSTGYGYLVQKCHYLWMAIKMTGKYGGYPVVWYLCGKTGALAKNEKDLPVLSLFADKVILPLKGSPYLEDLMLTGTLTLN